METKYTVDYFIEKFEKIPEELFIVGHFCGTGDIKCANGHCGAISFSSNNKELAALKSLFMPIKTTAISTKLSDIFSDTISINALNINDGNVQEYRQPSPKQRILAALYDIKKLQQPEVKERVVYKTVVIDSKVRELTEMEVLG